MFCAGSRRGSHLWVQIFFVATCFIHASSVWSTPLDSDLIVAVLEGKLNKVELLLTDGAFPNVRDSSGRSVLTVAIDSGRAIIASTLRNAGADVQEACAESNLTRIDRNRLPAGLGNPSEPSKEQLGTYFSFCQYIAKPPFLPDDWPSAPLLRAAAEGNATKVQALLSSGSSPNSREPGPIGFPDLGRTALMLAALGGHSEVGKILFKFGAEPNAIAHVAEIANSSRMGISALTEAASRGRNDFIKLLVSNGASPDHFDETGLTALHIAVESNRPESVRVLAGMVEDIDARDPECQKPLKDPTLFAGHRQCLTPLALASYHGMSNIAIILLSLGANPELDGPAGWSAIHYAAGNGDKRLLKRLIEAGVSKDKLTEKRETPLLVAMDHRQFNLAEELLDLGANPRARTVDGSTVLRSAASSGNEKLVKRLLSLEVDPNSGAFRGVAPMMSSISPAVASLLVQKGAGIDKETRNGRTPLYFAIQQRDEELTNWLVKKGARLNVRPQGELNLVSLAAAVGLPESLETLLRAGADPNERALDGLESTPLMAAGGSVEAVRILLAHGADVDLERNDGMTAEELAKEIIWEESRKEVIDLLNASRDR